MNMRIINTSLAIFWFSLVLGLVSREWWMPPLLLAKAETPQTPMITAMMLMLTFWNFSKFWAPRRFATPRSRIDPELRGKLKSITSADPKVTDPQFIFDKPESSEPS